MSTYNFSIDNLLLVNWFVPTISFISAAYPSSAYVIAGAIPQVQTINGLVSAVAVVQFSYTFPAFFMLGYNVITDAASEDRPHVPGTGSGGRIDTWRDWSRWKRASVNSCFA